MAAYFFDTRKENTCVYLSPSVPFEIADTYVPSLRNCGDGWDFRKAEVLPLELSGRCVLSSC